MPDLAARRRVRHAGPIAPRLSLFYFFDYSSISAHSLMGWCAGHRSQCACSRRELTASPLRNRMVIAAHLVNAVLGCAPHSARCVRNETHRGVRRAGYLALVVERAKKCLDFTATLYFLHLLFCCAFRGAGAAKRVRPCTYFAHTSRIPQAGLGISSGGC